MNTATASRSWFRRCSCMASISASSRSLKRRRRRMRLAARMKQPLVDDVTGALEIEGDDEIVSSQTCTFALAEILLTELRPGTV